MASDRPTLTRTGKALAALLLVAATFAAYGPIGRAGFLNFDDPQYVTNNPKVFHGLNLEGVRWAFTTFHAANWHPLTWLSHMLDCQAFGENAAGHHWMNVALHAANALLLFGLLQRLTRRTWRSALVAALFALHPLHVESVAWVSERKDVLSTLFGLLSLWAYGCYAEARSAKCEVRSLSSEARKQGMKAGCGDREGPNVQPSTLDPQRRCYALAWLFLAWGLLSKPMLVTWPFVMLLLDYWPLRRLELAPARPRFATLRRLLWEKVPFFALSAASCVITFIAQSQRGAVVAVQKVSLVTRGLNAMMAYGAYLGKTFWPTNLAAFYPLTGAWLVGEVIVVPIVLLGVTLAAVWLARSARYVLFGWLWYGVTLIPVIGLVQVGSQAMADRYTYVPLIGVFVGVVWGTGDWLGRWPVGRVAWAASLCAAVLACAVATAFQVRHWQNSIRLFERAVRVCPGSALSHHNLGHALSLAGRQADAIPHFDEALRLQPGYPQAFYNRGNAVGVQGDLNRAVADYRAAIRSKPDYEQAYYSLGNALVLQGKLEEARTNFLAALRSKPDYAEAHTRLGNLLLLQGARAEAMQHLHEAVRWRPDYEEGHYYLAGELARQKEFTRAVTHLHAALRAKPDYPAALNDLAWILAAEQAPEVRDVPEAVRRARRACELTGHREPMYLDTLGVACSEAGQFAEAIEATDQAVQLAAASGAAALVSQLAARLEFYRQNRGYREYVRSGASTR